MAPEPISSGTVYAHTMLVLGRAASPWISTPSLAFVPNVSIIPPIPSEASCIPEPVAGAAAGEIALFHTISHA
jgi:hypothetical protein